MIATDSPLSRPCATTHRISRRQALRAFTLVEFLIGSLFLSAILALAIPRLWNMGSEARAAKQQAIYGSVRAAAQIAHAAANVHGQMGPTGSVEVDGTRISMVYGYPTASAAGIIAATGLDAANDQVHLSDGGAQPGNSITIAFDEHTARCAVVYTAPASAEAQPRIEIVGDAGTGAGC